MPYFHISTGLRGGYMPSSSFVLHAKTRRELKVAIAHEAETYRESGYVGANKRAIASIAALAWRDAKKREDYLPYALPVAPPHAKTNYCEAVFVSNATRDDFRACYKDPNNDGAAFVDLDILESPRSRDTTQSGANITSKQNAAFRADSIAERNAECEREYQEAWQAGSEWSDLGYSIAETRRDMLGLLIESHRERHAARETATPHICAALRATIRKGVESISVMREKRAKLLDQYGNQDGFAEFLPRA